MDKVNRVQILDEAVYISHNAKDRNPTILPQAMGK